MGPGRLVGVCALTAVPCHVCVGVVQQRLPLDDHDSGCDPAGHRQLILHEGGVLIVGSRARLHRHPVGRRIRWRIHIQVSVTDTAQQLECLL